MTTHQLVLIRHGQSQWNLENRFTGWTDVDLSEQGILEAKAAGKALKKAGFKFEIAFCSVLLRALKTLHYVLEEMDQLWIPEVKAWELNERHYGNLQGLNKAETAEKYGDEQVHQWRRSYSTRPPALEESDDRNPKNDAKYLKIDPEKLPATESLADAVARVEPYWREVIKPQMQQGRSIIIAAHGNSLRALVKILENLSDEKIMEVEIPTGKPLVYKLDKQFAVVGKEYLE